jgi:hypothetical protein
MKMSSRGSRATNGHVTTSEYTTYSITNTGVKILKGIGNNHSLPDYSHSPNSIYAKLKKDGKTLHEMRFYDKNGNPIIEIGYHPEPIINNGDRVMNILHYHVYSGLDRINVERMSDHPDVKEKYSIYLKEFDLYD